MNNAAMGCMKVPDDLAGLSDLPRSCGGPLRSGLLAQADKVKLTAVTAKTLK